MKIDLIQGEEILHTIKGRAFITNPIARVILKFVKLIGKYTNVEVAITNQRVHVYEEHKFLWFIVVGRDRKIFSLADIDMLQGIQTTFLFIFKSNNLIIYNGGIPWTGVNIKSSNYQNLESELSGISLAKTNYLREN
jgi:hypothetical protein